MFLSVDVTLRVPNYPIVSWCWF